MNRRGRGPAAALALASIRAYQRFVSPHKGYCCAYRACAGAPSCSQFGHRAIARHGLRLGWRLLRRRLLVCAAHGGASRQAALQPVPRGMRRQAGFLDCGDALGCLDCLDFADFIPRRCIPSFKRDAPGNSASAALRARVEAARRRGREH